MLPRWRVIRAIAATLPLAAGCSFLSSGDDLSGGAVAPPTSDATSEEEVDGGGDEATVAPDSIADPSDAAVDAPSFGDAIVLATGQLGPSSIAVFGPDVYFSNFEGNTIGVVPKATGPVQLFTVGEGYPPQDVFPNPNAIIWLKATNSYNPLFTMEHDGGTPTWLPVVGTDNGKLIRAAEDGSSYVAIFDIANEWGVVRYQKSLATWSNVTTRHSGTASSITSDGLVYYVSVDSNIVAVDGAGNIRTLAPGQLTPTDVATDADSVFWLTSDGRVCRLDKANDAGGAVVDLATGQPGLARLTLYGDAVYFTAGGAVGDGRVRSVPKQGGKVTELAQGLSGPLGIAIDETGVYVAVHDDGMVLRIPR